jgi:hypothetical protein
MRKQVMPAVLSGLLCVSAFAQRVEISREVSFLHLQSSYNAGWSSVLTGNFEEASENARADGVLEVQANSCANRRSLLLEVVVRDRDGRHFHEVPVWQLSDSNAFFFVSGMTIDADGAPNAYNPDDTGLDELANAGEPAHWNGIITGRDGNPLTQREGDPFPGYFISCTSLTDETKKFTDPTGYVDASKIAYIALPQDVANRGGARLGDFAVVTNLHNGKSSFAIYADIGTLGEGSIALADALGIYSDARRGGQSEGILYLLFPGSGNGRPRTVGDILSESEKLLPDHRRRIEELSSCVDSDDPVSATMLKKRSDTFH